MSKLHTARKLARAHFKVEPHLRYVAILEPLRDDDPKDPIRLLEVVEGTIERGFQPVAFAPSEANGIEYPSLVIEISPSEYRSAKKNGMVRLGDTDWEIGEEIRRARASQVL